ncbi:zinc ABC transporter, periplasmic zinc-binding protein [Oceanimonas sp. GK1]|uniref:zinc ABC transporter substrate-binding protein ZnuA n=1 Tax=Oceanimonas sp. (strain GK1 / IBRC-M 10197) TaxID=511062 RepID=UPI0002494F47|nr:zinc ABC transporter substrate-binding protein ZnuA [Oceanimonas sp. GK1]AEY00776.1 zinc ABC transporter, periplasmic zinc-binding protein [Oceanimonas sp. GK1]
MRALFFLGLLLGSQANAVEVLTTVKPLQLIASAITEGGQPPGLLLKPGTSPHDYALKPSDLGRIQDADLVIWVGPELEGFLTPLLSERDNSLPLLTRLPVEHHDHDEHDEHDETDHHDNHNAPLTQHENDAHDDHHGHDHTGRDPHVWLDPHNGLHIARLIAERLGAIDPENLDRYQHNLALFESKLRDTDRRVMERLTPARGIGYFVFHDAYGYWEAHYQIPSLGHFTVNPERAPGAQTVARIHRALENASAECVFAEPQFRPAVINAVVRGTQARVAVLDPLAGDIDNGPDGYFNFMLKLADDMAVCLLNER